MRRNFQLFLSASVIAASSLLCVAAPSGSAVSFPERTRDPYVGAIAIDADTGAVLFEDNADATVYPASVVKLMHLLIILEKSDSGAIKLTDTVHVTEEASKIGGSDMWLDPRESFPLDDMLYMLMVQSANDAAVALAIHVAGGTSGFVEMMNKRAADLGLQSTKYYSVNGLITKRGQLPDVSTPREMAALGRVLLKHPDTLRYTSTREKRIKREIGKTKETVMRSHNRLLQEFPGCDGLKTGWFSKAGFSIVVTAKRNDRRVIAAVMGSKARKTRDTSAKEILTRAFLVTPPPPPPATNVVAEAKQPVQEPKPERMSTARIVAIGAIAVAAFIAVWTLVAFVVRRSRYEFDN